LARYLLILKGLSLEITNIPYSCNISQREGAFYFAGDFNLRSDERHGSSQRTWFLWVRTSVSICVWKCKEVILNILLYFVISQFDIIGKELYLSSSNQNREDLLGHCL
jgi:hypothetical protein